MKHLSHLLIILLLLSLGACGGEARRQAHRTEVEAMVRRYVKILPSVYMTGDLDVISGVATIREREAIKRGMTALSQRGYALRVSLVECQIVYVDIFNESNAYVKTTERWDVTMLNKSTGSVKGTKKGELLHVTYQLKDFRDEGWQVTERIVQETKRSKL